MTPCSAYLLSVLCLLLSGVALLQIINSLTLIVVSQRAQASLLNLADPACGAELVSDRPWSTLATFIAPQRNYPLAFDTPVTVGVRLCFESRVSLVEFTGQGDFDIVVLHSICDANTRIFTDDAAIHGELSGIVESSIQLCTRDAEVKRSVIAFKMTPRQNSILWNIRVIA